MRVITGSARGMSLRTLEGETTRPTTEKVKEAVFSAIQFEIEGRRVLDLFAGSGQMGIEALSRGAISATFVYQDKRAIGVIKENVEKTKFTKESQIVQMDAIGFLNMNIRTYDIVFLDPPYSTGLLEKSLERVTDYVAEGGIVICEYPFKDTVPVSPEGFNEYRTYKYSKTAVTIFRKV